MKEVMKSIMAVIGIVLLSITLLLTLGLSFKGFRNKMRDIFDVVPEKQILSIQDENEDLNKIQANIQTTIDGLNKEKAELESTIEALENQADVDQSTIAGYQAQLENLNNRIVELQNQMSNIQANVNGAIVRFVGAFPRITFWNSDDFGGGYDRILSGSEGNEIGVDAEHLGMHISMKEYEFEEFTRQQAINPFKVSITHYEIYDFYINGASTALSTPSNVVQVSENVELNTTYKLDGEYIDRTSLFPAVGSYTCVVEFDILYTIDAQGIVDSITLEVVVNRVM